MNLKNLKLSSLALSFRVKGFLKPWRIDAPWCWIYLIGGNPSILLKARHEQLFRTPPMWASSSREFQWMERLLLWPLKQIFSLSLLIPSRTHLSRTWIWIMASLLWTRNMWNSLHNQIVVIKRFCFADSRLRFFNESNISLNTSVTHLIVGCRHVSRWWISLGWLVFN